MKVKSYLYLLMVAVSSITVSAQKMTTADKFINYFNKYQKNAIIKITTSDFKFKDQFSEETMDKYEFLTDYFDDCETVIAKYKVIKKTTQKNKSYYVVEEQSQYLKLLNIKFAKWNMTITTLGGKVSQVILSPTKDYDNYITELNSKTEKFNSWMKENHPEVDLDKLEDLSQILEYLNDYNISKGILLSDLQQYDESTGIPESLIYNDSGSDNMTCAHRNKFTEAERASFYPFNKAKKVLLISFTDKDRIIDYYAKTPRITDIAMAKSSKQLRKVDINRLTDIFYNYGFKTMKLEKHMVAENPDCPELKCAIVFVDENNKPFEYIAFSFHCDEVEFSSEKVSYGDECSTKREFLKDFFVSKGIDLWK